MSDDFDVDYSDRSGFLVGRAAALADWALRKDEREFNKIVVALYMRRYRSAKIARGECTVCKLPAKGRMCPGHLAIWRRQSERWRRKRGANPKTFILMRRGGEVHHLSEWARITGAKVSTLFARWRAGWDTERCLTEPVMLKGRFRPTCKRGHPRSPSSLYGSGDGPRTCKQCCRERYVKVRDERAVNGLCISCGRAPPDGPSRCKACKARRHKRKAPGTARTQGSATAAVTVREQKGKR